MTELKTLNEIEVEQYPIPWIKFNELKAEAIKWVKAGDKSSLTDWRRVFRKFNNLTEEDLK